MSVSRETLNGATGPLAFGWHRVTWRCEGTPQHVVTPDVASAAEAYSSLKGFPTATHVRIESWSDYPYDKTSGGYTPEVSRETFGGGACTHCGSNDVTPYETKPPRKHPGSRIECDDDCVVASRLCRACRMVSRETVKET